MHGAIMLPKHVMSTKGDISYHSRLVQIREASPVVEVTLRNTITITKISLARHVDERRHLLSFRLVQIHEVSPVVEVTLCNTITITKISLARHVDERRHLLSFRLVQIREATPVVEVTLRNTITITKISLARHVELPPLPKGKNANDVLKNRY
jgi:hypothetical protein